MNTKRNILLPTHDQQYKVYENSYKSHANSSLIGCGLTKWGIMGPGVLEYVIPNYKLDLKTALNDLYKKNKLIILDIK